MSSTWLAWPRIGGYLESKKLWSVKPALPYLNPNSQVLGELTKPFRWFYMKGNLVGSRPSCCWGAHQVSLRAPRTRQSLTGFSVGSRGHESPRRVGVRFRSFLWCSSNTSPIMGILLSHNDHLSTRSIDFVILLNNKKERLNLFFINESQNSDDFLPFFSWPEDHFTHLNYNLFSRFHLLFPTSCVNAFMCLTVICLRGSAMNNAASGQIFHVIIFYEACQESSSFINLNELLSSKGPSPQTSSWSCFYCYMLEWLIWPTSSFPFMKHFRRNEPARSS